jgi:hypothetical protein
MRGMHIDRSERLCLNPTPENAAARKHKRVRTLSVEHGQLEIAIERCSADRLPHAYPIHDLWVGGIDLHQRAFQVRPLSRVSA